MTPPDIPALKRELDAFLASFDREAHVARDPVEYVRRFRQSPDDAEVVGLLSASLAFGRVEQIRQKIAWVLLRLGDHPAREIRRLGKEGLRETLAPFRHRWTTGEDLADLLAGADALRAKEGSLGKALLGFFQKEGDLRRALYLFGKALREARQGPLGSFAHLVPDALAGSACKRLLLYARWMTRPDDGVDLGLFPLPKEALVIPLDTHIARISYYIGLTRRQDTSWRTAEDITRTLRLLDPKDPVKYDFALCHLGISGACPRRRHPVQCRECPIQRVCRL